MSVNLYSTAVKVLLNNPQVNLYLKAPSYEHVHSLLTSFCSVNNPSPDIFLYQEPSKEILALHITFRSHSFTYVIKFNDVQHV